MSVVQKKIIDRVDRIGHDIQLTVLDPMKEYSQLKKYLKLDSGFFDHEKKILEMNICGGVAHQVNLVFEFDYQKVEKLVK